MGYGVMDYTFDQLKSGFRELGSYRFTVGLFSGWSFGVSKIGDKDIPTISVDFYNGIKGDKSTPFITQKFPESDLSEHVDVMPNTEDGDVFQAYITGNLPAFMQGLSDNFTTTGLKQVFLKCAKGMGYAPGEDLDQASVITRSLFAGASEQLEPGDGWR